MHCFAHIPLNYSTSELAIGKEREKERKATKKIQSVSLIPRGDFKERIEARKIRHCPAQKKKGNREFFFSNAQLLFATIIYAGSIRLKVGVMHHSLKMTGTELFSRTVEGIIFNTKKWTKKKKKSPNIAERGRNRRSERNEDGNARCAALPPSLQHGLRVSSHFSQLPNTDGNAKNRRLTEEYGEFPYIRSTEI